VAQKTSGSTTLVNLMVCYPFPAVIIAYCFHGFLNPDLYEIFKLLFRFSRKSLVWIVSGSRPSENCFNKLNSEDFFKFTGGNRFL
jgi:hypothetical protein